jgi:hypothetical protein
MQGNPLGQVTKNLPNSHVHLYTRWLEPGGGQLSKLSWAQNRETRTKG